MIVYARVGGAEPILFEDHVLERFRRCRQLGAHEPEAGGQLFARLENARVIVSHASGPKTRDRRGRFTFRPHRRLEQREIRSMYRRGLHYVGDWHTHPEPRPTGSRPDLQSIGEIVRLSTHGFGAFLLVVVGTLEPPDGLAVYLHNGSRPYRLQPITALVAVEEPA